MICKICGASNAEGTQFCNDCGAPLMIQNQVQQQMHQELQQQLENQRMEQHQRQQQLQQQLEQRQQQQAQQQNQQYVLQQQQPVQQQNQQYVPQQQQAQQQNQQYVPQQQPVQQQNQNYMPPQQQPVQQQNQQYVPQQQQAQQQNQQYVPQQQNQNYMSPQQQPVQQQNQQYVPQQQPVMQTEPQHSMQKQSKSSDRIKKGKKKGPIIFIIVFILLAALATAFIIFILPKLSKGEPKGEYVNNDFAGHILFDDGVYAVYDSNGGYELGTYEVKGDKITFTDANGDIDYGKYNKKDNTVEYGYLFELNDSKETFDIDIDKKYVKGLKEKISDAATEVCADDEILTEAEMLNGSYYICDTELADKNTAFTSALSDKLGYGSDNILSYLIENKFIAIDISVNISSKTADVTIY